MSNREFKFKIDENLPIKAANLFNRFGYDAETVLDEELQGFSDDELFLTCKKENRILVTFDLDFSDVRTYSPGTHPGVIVIRLADQSVDATLSVINKIISTFKEETPIGSCG